MQNCAVIYLERWCNKPYFSQTFLSSITRFTAGAGYDYVHVLKGFQEGTTSEPLEEYRKSVRLNTQVFRVSDEKLPTGTLLPILKELPHEKILLFMSWSRLLAPNWLRSYLSAFDSVESCGIVGATSGYERSNYKDLTQPFPNIGVRTTGFMIDRRMFIDMADGYVTTRNDEINFESGTDGLTKKIMRRGLKPVVVDKAGKAWRAEEWPRSKTFRSGFQEGLLVADNRTYDYDVSPPKRRKWLAEINWGAEADAPPASYKRRLNSYLDWHYRSR
ncbi:MAG: hypothetical protein HY052_05605 [Proteobacteria bacterium]|nr:hypothetical protein [Pseudomonadota bacterium]